MFKLAKQAKIMKDQTAFVEGYAYRWDNQSRNRGPGNRNRHNAMYRGYVIQDDYIESDSSISSSILQAHQPQCPHSQTGSRKQGYHGGGNTLTPSTKKTPDNSTQFAPVHGQSQGAYRQGDGQSQSTDISQYTYPIAYSCPSTTPKTYDRHFNPVLYPFKPLEGVTPDYPIHGNTHASALPSNGANL